MFEFRVLRTGLVVAALLFLSAAFTVGCTDRPDYWVGDLQVSPAEVGIGEPVQVSFEVTNRAARSGSESVYLYVDGASKGNRRLSFSRGVETFSFTVSSDRPGTHTVSVSGTDDVSGLPRFGQFVVVDRLRAVPPATTTTTTLAAVPTLTARNTSTPGPTLIPGIAPSSTPVSSPTATPTPTPARTSTSAPTSTPGPTLTSNPPSLPTPRPTPTTSPTPAGPVTIDFDRLAVPESGAATFPQDQFRSQGVILSNVDPTTGGKGPFTAVRNNLWGNGAHSLPYSVVFGFQGRRIEVTFVDAASGGEAVTDHVSAWVGDLSPESDPITMTAYDRDSKVIGQSGFTSQPSGMLGVGNFGRVEIRAAGIYRVVFTDADPSGADLDDLTFNPPTRLPP